MSDIETEIADLQAEMADTRGREVGGYWNNPEKQARYQALLEAQETGGTVSRPSASEARITELRELMADRSGRYWNSPAAASLQDEYRRLLEGEEPRVPAVPAQSPDGLDVDGWSKALGVEPALVKEAEARASEILSVDPDAEMVFEGLSDGLQHSILGMLADPSQRLSIIARMDDADYDSFLHAVETMPEASWEKAKLILGLSDAS